MLLRLIRVVLRVYWPALADLVLPVACPGCGRVGVRWCASCRSPFRHAGLRAVAGLPPVVVLAPYAGPARSVVLAYKERGRRDLAAGLAASVVAALVATGVARGPGCLTVVPAPSRRSASRARGGDHMVRLARALARSPEAAGVTVARALALRAGARDSVGLDAAARAGNLARHLRVRPRALPPPGTSVLLLDDVLTTGATARAATAALARAGVRVAAVVVLTAAPPHRQRRPRSAARGRGSAPGQPGAPDRSPYHPHGPGPHPTGRNDVRHLPRPRWSHYRGPPHFSTRDGEVRKVRPSGTGCALGGVTTPSPGECPAASPPYGR